MNLIKEIKTGLEKLEQSNKELIKFAVTIAAALVVLAVLVWFFGHVPSRAYWLAGIAFLFLLFGYTAPALLKPVHTFWMGLALFLGYFMSRLLLGIVFFLVLTPISFIMRLSGKDLLDQKLDKAAPTYWKKRPLKVRQPQDYERLF